MRVQLKEGQVLMDGEGNTYEGAEPFDVPRSSFWIRRIADGSVTEVEAETTKAAKTPRPKK